MNVLITGAAGFIGSHLVDRLLDDGHRVAGVDNLLTGSLENLDDARTRAGFVFIEADVTEEWLNIFELLEREEAAPGLIVHLASPASPVDYGRFPLETMAVNSRGTDRCCRAALRFGATLVYASTSEVYGDPAVHPQRESYWGNVNPIGPRSCYDESKRFGEALVMSFVRTGGLDCRIARIFNTYGPRMRKDDGRVVPNFIFQAMAGHPLTVYGDGSQTRSFCYVADLVEGIVRLAAAQSASGLVVNLGNPSERTILELAQIVASAVGVPMSVRRQPLPVDDPSRRCPDITRAREVLDWEPKISVEDGIARTVSAFLARTVPNR